MVDALRRLAERSFVELRRDYLTHLEGLLPDEPDASLMVGETGLVLVRHRLSPSGSTQERLRELVAANVGSDGREILIGSPGTMLVARELGFDDLWQESADRLLADRDPETGLWEQNLWGRRASTSAPRTASPAACSRSASSKGRRRSHATTRTWKTAWRTGPRMRTGSSSRKGRFASSGVTVLRE